MENYTLLYNRESINLEKFMERNYIYNFSLQEFFDLNKDFIFNQMSESDKVAEMTRNGKYPESSSEITTETILPSPCILKILSNKVTAEIAISQTNLQTISSDYYAFTDEKIQEIIQNEGYIMSNASKKEYTCQVFGWFKSLYYVGLSKDNKVTSLGKNDILSEFANLSKYIISMSTSVTNNGGSFVIKLPIINSSTLGISVIQDQNKQDVGEFANIQKSVYRYYDEFYSKNTIEDLEKNYFNWLISSNDLLFLSFEKLDMEFKRSEFSLGDEDNFDINTVIANGVYDMIGLVDDVKMIGNYMNSDAYIEITGRDLMKLLIEDGSFFFNPSVTSDPSLIFANEASYGKQGDVREADMLNNNYNNPINRIRRITGEIDIFASRINMDLGYILKGVISQLANVEVVPGYVFDSWGNDRTKFIELQPEKK